MAMTLITNSADTDSTDLTGIVFNSSIDSTYKLYIFKFIDINPATDNVTFSFQVNATDDDGGDYDTSLITSTTFKAYHNEANTDTSLAYDTETDQAQAAGFQILLTGQGNGGDESAAGTLYLFNPSSTTYVKHFYATMNSYFYADYIFNQFTSGYINDTTAIDDIKFKMSSGNFDGTIKMYGVG